MNNYLFNDYETKLDEYFMKNIFPSTKYAHIKNDFYTQAKEFKVWIQSLGIEIVQIGETRFLRFSSKANETFFCLKFS